MEFPYHHETSPPINAEESPNILYLTPRKKLGAEANSFVPVNLVEQKLTGEYKGRVSGVMK